MTQDWQQPEETLGQRIKAIRKMRGWSREKLAEKVGTASLTILRWENDRAFPRGDEVQRALIEVLGLPKDEFSKQRERQIKEKKVPTVADEVTETKGEIKSEAEEAPFPVEIVLPRQYEYTIIPSEKELSEDEIVEYKIPPIIVYRGFYKRVFDERYGYDLERMVLSNGERLFPYYTWVNPDTVVFGWGHVGGGSTHLAQSILLDYFEYMYPNEKEEVLRSFVEKYYRNFATDFTIWFGREKNWELWSGAITAWLKEERENGDPAPSHDLGDVGHGWVGWSERWDKYRGT